MIHLTHKNPDAKSPQFYHLDIIPSLLGNWGVQREWGAIGNKGKQRIDWYETREDAQNVAAQLAESKINTWFRQSDMHPSRKVTDKSVKPSLKSRDATNAQKTLWGV